jgi:peptidoglycan/LPS O-acetylase OafA/YrhL
MMAASTDTLPAALTPPAAARAATSVVAHEGAIPCLDGLRAVSVLIVVLSHIGLGHIVPGGLGVTVFFFLSGFLITTLLLREFDKNGSIHIPYFYARRVLRLAPALVIALLLAYGLALAGWLQGKATVNGFLAQLFYLANYYFVFASGESSVPNGTVILWSLAVEEHFYIVYPLVLAWALQKGSARHAAWWMAGACVLVLAWRWHLTADPAFNPSRIYYATDTRVDSILFGCILACTFNPATASRPMNGKLASLLLAAGLFLLAGTLTYREPRFRETLRYSLQGAALMAIFYALIAAPATWAHQLLNRPLLLKLGAYSYVIYLTHHVIIHLCTEHLSATPSPATLFVAAMSSSVALAALLDSTVDRYFAAWRRRLRDDPAARPGARQRAVDEPSGWATSSSTAY